MNSQDLKNKIKKLPDSPGVYFFKKGRKILYIGKATSLRDRVTSYFNVGIENARGPIIWNMLGKIDNISYQKTDSVLEAIILESNLIKKYEPEANIRDKDNKSFNYVIITKEDYPRVLLMRTHDLEKFFLGTSLEKHGNFLLKISSVRRRSSSRGFSQEDASTNFPKNNFEILNLFGPFPNAGQLREALKIVRKIFPFRDKCVPAETQKPHRKRLLGKACFNRQIGLCPGVCTGEISKEDYKKQIKNIVLFFEGNKKRLLKNLEKEMREFAKKREFEKAEKRKRQIFALQHIQDVSLIKNDMSKSVDSIFRIESYDIAHLSGTNVVGVMTVVENHEAKKSDYRKFNIKINPGINDTAALSEVLSRRLNHPEWPMANIIVVDGGEAQKNAMEKVLREKNINIPVVSVVKDEKHRPREIIGIEILKDLKIEDLNKKILLANAESHRFAISFHRHRRRKIF